MSIGEIIRLRREKAGLSQDDLAARVGVAKTKISEIENGHSDPRLSTLQRYAKALGVSVSTLLRGLSDGE